MSHNKNKKGGDLAFRRDNFLWHKNIYAIKICNERIGAMVKPNNTHHSSTRHSSTHHANNQLTTLSRPQAWISYYQYSGIQLLIPRPVSINLFVLLFRLP